MKNKVIKMIISFAAAAAISGCTLLGTNSINKAKEDIKNEDYSSALQHLRDAKEAGIENSEVDFLINVFDNYIAALELYNQGNVEDAKTKIEAVPDTASAYVFWNNISELSNRIDIEIYTKEVNEKISEVKQMVAAGDYNQAVGVIAVLESGQLTDSQKNEIASLKQTINSAQAQIESAAQIAEETARRQAEEEAKRNANTNTIKKTMYVVKCNEFITLRSTPSTSASEITKIPLGSSVGYIEEAGNGFYKVNYGGNVGYALASYLSDTKETNTVKKKMYVVKCNEFITLRSTPSTSASEITKIPLGSSVGYIEEAGNGFYKVQYDGKIGYALASYLSDNR